MGIAILKLCTK